MTAAKRSAGRAVIVAEIARSARLDRGYLMHVALAASLAHLGLLMDSVAVIIGAMLISPLMGPIMGLGFGLAIWEFKLLRRSLVTLAAGMVLAIAVGAAITLLSPMRDVTPQILARVRPNLLDLFVAVFGGIAGAFALIKRNAISMVGVAIATALVPPLAVVGFGLATGRLWFAGGAFLLFVTNAAAIALMATASARAQGFGHTLSHRQTAYQSIGIVASLAILAVPLGLSLRTIVRESKGLIAINSELQKQAGPGSRVTQFNLDYDARPIRLNGVVIVPRYVPELEASVFKRAREVLGVPIEGQILQLREDNEKALIEDRLARQSGVEEEQSRRTIERIAAATAVASGLDRNRISVDPVSKLVIATIATDEDAEVTAGRERAFDVVRAAFPGWMIRSATSLSPLPLEPEPAVPDTPYTDEISAGPQPMR